MVNFKSARGIISLCLALFLCLGLAACGKQEAPSKAETPQSEPSSAAEEKAEAPLPAELSALLGRAGQTEAALKDKACRQLITVEASGSRAEIRFFCLENGAWQEKADLKTAGFVGEQGVTEDMSESKRMTPAGLFTVGEAFYKETAPTTALESFKITPETYWVDDPDSKFYNTRVEGTAEKDWKSAEHMIDYAAYRYGFTIGYNLDCVAGRGSAIFFHVSESPTLGCVGAEESAVLAFLAELDPAENPHILIF